MDSKLLHDMFALALPLAEKILRPIVVYAFLIFGFRLAGKRELAQLNPFDLVVLLTISNTVQNAIIGDDNSVTGGLLGAATLLFVNHCVVRFLYTHQRLDQLVEGAPNLLIESGRIQFKRLKKELITRNELEAAAHKQGFASLDQIDRAVLEPGGGISFVARQPSPETARHDAVMAELGRISAQLAPGDSDRRRPRGVDGRKPARLQSPARFSCIRTDTMNRYTNVPPLPDRLSRLDELAVDLWWSWHHEGRTVFRHLDYALWRQTAHNPVRMLALLPRETLEAAAHDPALLVLYDEAIRALDAARHAHNTWWSARFPQAGGQSIAYFSAEFALHQSLPIYAGGLGVLAGDHCKEAGDLGVPLIGVGFMYPQGYFHQHVSAEGWQEESYERLNWADAPIEPATTPDGRPCVTAVPLGDRSVLAAVWQVRMGRVTLYLLDTDLEENAPWDRELSARLYGGDRETRIQQEIVLGIGGVRALKALGIDPAVFHLNEGHAAFVVLQRIRDLIEQGGTFDEALDEIRATTVFTTHTPVPAGHDAFAFHLVEKHLAGCWGTLGPNRDRFLALGSHDSGAGSQFNMTALALRSAGAVNAVSELHGQVTRSMWASIWPEVAEPDRPVRSVTNGVHVPTWIASDLDDLFVNYLGPDWRDRHDEPEIWDGILTIPDAELWAVRQNLKRYLFTFMRERARQRWTEDRVGTSRVVAAGSLLEPDALTLGFARRFTGYKRPELVFHDPERLARILKAASRPVQIIFAGKSHPADDIGKHHLQRVYTRALDPMYGGRIAFVDDYDLHVAHFLVQGCDIWLNTPRKPNEASGTSGMKASLNGVPHLSIADGWWAEGFNGANGWVINGASTGDQGEVDAADAAALYHLLEEEIVPAYYDRDASAVPRRWLATVKEAIRSVAPRFSSRRMVKEYVERMYAPAVSRRLAVNG